MTCVDSVCWQPQCTIRFQTQHKGCKVKVIQLLILKVSANTRVQFSDQDTSFVTFNVNNCIIGMLFGW